MSPTPDKSLAPIDAALLHRVLPPRAPAPEGQPALLMLHGRGADELDLLGLVRELDPRLLVISARAPFHLGFGYHWYELLEIGRPEPRTFSQGLRLLEEFSREIIDGYGIDPARLYALGFSQGAMMAGSLTLTHPGRVAGTIMLSGYLPLRAGVEVDTERLARQPFFLAHGTRDGVIPVGFGREARDFLTSVHTDLSYHEYPIGHEISDEELRDVAGWLTTQLGSGGG